MPSYLDTFEKFKAFFLNFLQLYMICFYLQESKLPLTHVAHTPPYSHLAFYPELHSAPNSWIVFLFSLWFIFIEIINNNLQRNLYCSVETGKV